MAIYKYVTPEAIPRFLQTWALRITPPNEFNDPFEMRSLFETLSPAAFGNLNPKILREELSKEVITRLIEEGCHTQAANNAAGSLVPYFLNKLSNEEELQLIDGLRTHGGATLVERMPAIRTQFKQLQRTLLLEVTGQIPAWNALIQKTMHDGLINGSVFCV